MVNCSTNIFGALPFTSLPTEFRAILNKLSPLLFNNFATQYSAAINAKQLVLESSVSVNHHEYLVVARVNLASTNAAPPSLSTIDITDLSKNITLRINKGHGMDCQLAAIIQKYELAMKQAIADKVYEQGQTHMRWRAERLAEVVEEIDPAKLDFQI